MAWNVRLPTADYYPVNDPRMGELLNEVAAQDIVALDTETTGLENWKCVPLFFSMAWGDRRVCLPAEALCHFRGVFADETKCWVFANAKFDLHMLANVGYHVDGKILDTQVMHALLYEEQPHALDHMGKQLLGWQWKDMFEGWDKRKQPNVGDFIMGLFASDPVRLIEYASNDAHGTLKIYEKLEAELRGQVTFTLYPDRYRTLWDYFYKVESPFTKVLWTCERNGMLIDQSYLSEISRKAGADLDQVDREVQRLVGRPINMNSPAQLRDYFFETLKLRPLGYTNGGKSGVKQPQTDYDFLEHYALDVPVAKLMLQYRDLAKLKGTYADGLPDFFDNNGRIHTSYNQDVARTGRLSSSAPNLQNIPNPERDSWLIRKAFISSPGKSLIDFDYSALEMRILAAASGDKTMIEAFNSGLDPHSFNASKTFNLPYEDIIKAKKKDKKDLTEYDKRCVRARSDVKTTVGFGVLYGMKERSLALRLGCTEREAVQLIDQFMERNPAVATFMSETLEETRATGYAYTVLGRRRFFPEILSGSRAHRSQAERAAGNLPIQGTAADIMKMAMILIHDARLDLRFGCKMQLQVHDEILFECPDESCDEAMQEIGMWMEHPLPSEIPLEPPHVFLTAEGKKAKNWADAK